VKRNFALFFLECSSSVASAITKFSFARNSNWLNNKYFTHLLSDIANSSIEKIKKENILLVPAENRNVGIGLEWSFWEFLFMLVHVVPKGGHGV
jgi:hypothetical protein